MSGFHFQNPISLTSFKLTKTFLSFTKTTKREIMVLIQPSLVVCMSLMLVLYIVGFWIGQHISHQEIWITKDEALTTHGASVPSHKWKRSSAY